MSSLAKNIVLIGMPGAGKSTAGALLAQQLSLPYLDTDDLIETAAGISLQTLVDRQGRAALLALEEATLRGMNVAGHIIATGGSAVYSPRAMQHLKSAGWLVFLDVSLAALSARITNFATRGIARAPNQSLEDLFLERRALYQHYADQTLASDHLSAAAASASIIEAYQAIRYADALI